jgi:hypothetical protein
VYQYSSSLENRILMEDESIRHIQSATNSVSMKHLEKNGIRKLRVLNQSQFLKILDKLVKDRVLARIEALEAELAEIRERPGIRDASRQAPLTDPDENKNLQLPREPSCPATEARDGQEATEGPVIPDVDVPVVLDEPDVPVVPDIPVEPAATDATDAPDEPEGSGEEAPEPFPGDLHSEASKFPGLGRRPAFEIDLHHEQLLLQSEAPAPEYNPMAEPLDLTGGAGSFR